MSTQMSHVRWSGLTALATLVCETLLHSLVESRVWFLTILLTPKSMAWLIPGVRQPRVLARATQRVGRDGFARHARDPDGPA